MATDALSYTGINRAYSDFAGSRACEELINLRPATEGVVPVKDFSVKMADVPYRKVFIHYTTSGPHYIVVRAVTDEDAVLVQYVDDDGDEIGLPLFSTPYDGEETIESISLASAGNILLISLCDKENGRYGNAAYIWKEGSYAKMEATVPSGFDFEVSDDSAFEEVTESVSTIDASSDASDVALSVESALNAIQEKNPRLCIGPIIVAVAFKTSDGSTFWANGWRLYDPEPLLRSASGRYKNASYSWWANEEYAAYYAKYPDGGYVLSGLTQSTAEVGGITKITVPGTNVKVNFDAVSGWSEETSIIRSVEVYASRPKPYIDATSAGDGFLMMPQPLLQCALMVPKADYENMDLAGQLLYHQASIPMASLADGDQTVELTFGGNTQATEDTLDTDAGELVRYGRVLAYNARFHYFDSVSVLRIGMPYFQQPGSASSAETADVFVRYSDGERDGLFYSGQEQLIRSSSVESDTTRAVVAPSMNVKEVIVLFGGSSGPWHVERYRMQSSTAYNYSIRVGGPYQTSDTSSSQYVQDLIDAKTNGNEILTEEPDAINVTEQYNPFVFLVEHSYKAPGNIIDVQTQMAGITDSSYGRDPLSVFTERGTYALTQGSANVLYGAFLPVSNNVISRGRGSSVPTEAGIFFLADGALWLLSGRRATLVSDALHLGPHKYIRACDGYKRISGVDENYSPAPSGVTITPEYDISPALSEVSFEQFVRTGARLSFNRFRMELLVSNPSYGYTYVLSLKYRQWFKIGRRLWQDEAGSDIACTPGATLGNIDVVDLSTEEATAQVLVHMQTRPFSMGYRYIHMHRIVAMVRARLSGTAGDKLVVGLYGSDDLQEWHLLSYAKRNGRTTSTTDDPPVVTDHPLKVSQIRTASSSRSWRYYTVCIGGPVPPDADLGPVLVDYKPVIRRIG